MNQAQAAPLRGVRSARAGAREVATSRRFLALLAAAALPALAGCGIEAQHGANSRVAMQTIAGAPAAAPAPAAEVLMRKGAQDSDESAVTKSAPAISRKIIYNTEIDLVPQDLTTAEKELRRLVRSAGGYVADTEVSGQPGAARQGEWTVRVPVERFETFVWDVVRLGELQRIHTDSQDVTEDYYDSGARLANKRVEEQRLLHHLQASTGKLQEILQVEHEISRVREEIEQLQGHIQKLSRLSELATVKVQMHEVKEYVPPKATGFGAQVGRTFHDSMVMLRDAIEGAVLFIVAVVPWLLALAILAVPVVVLIRRSRTPRERPHLL